MSSAPASGTTGFGARGAFSVDGVEGVPKGSIPQEPSIEAATGDGPPIPETVLVTDTTTVAEVTVSPSMSETTAIDPATATSTGLVAGAPSSWPQIAAATALMGADDNAVEEPEVIMGHPSLRAPSSA
jgi:hypothetical protein